MTISEQSLASIRFGYGFSAQQRGPVDRDELLGQLKLNDPYLTRPLIAPSSARLEWSRMFRTAIAARKKDRPNKRALLKSERRAHAKIITNDIRAHYIRPVFSSQPFRERLIAFWSDHFTVSALNRRFAIAIPDMVQTAIRPHVTGRFSDMLQAVTTHPAMLSYLNQNQSVGPNSVVGERSGRGLNENLAREILELHTLGVTGNYTQLDVREFAELLTGLRSNKNGFYFSPKHAERGAETVLGKSYGGAKARLEDPLSALEDIALRRDTARHLASKLVTHFVGDPPDSAHVEIVARAYIQSNGNLMKVYEALLGHENAWIPELKKVRTPFELQIATIRALGVSKVSLSRLGRGGLRRKLTKPLEAMGQPLMRPKGPDGWPEDPEYWITPANLTARINWALDATHLTKNTSDPRKLLNSALRDMATPNLARAVAGAATRKEGLALIFASPEFNRR